MPEGSDATAIPGRAGLLCDFCGERVASVRRVATLSLALLVAVEFAGAEGGGAQRWINLGPFLIQPSELMKVALVLALARYYEWLPPRQKSNPLA